MSFIKETHVLMEYGATCAESGLKIVERLEECRNLKQFVELFYPDIGSLQEKSSSSYPKGCVVRTNFDTDWSGLYFNGHGYGGSNGDSRQICKLIEVSDGKIIKDIFHFLF